MPAIAGIEVANDENGRFSGYFGGQYGAQNGDFLHNQAENQNGDVGFAANLSAVGSMFGGDANQISNESEMEHTPNLTVFDLMSVDTGDANFSPFSNVWRAPKCFYSASGHFCA